MATLSLDYNDTIIVNWTRTRILNRPRDHEASPLFQVAQHAPGHGQVKPIRDAQRSFARVVAASLASNRA